MNQMKSEDKKASLLHGYNNVNTHTIHVANKWTGEKKQLQQRL